MQHCAECAQERDALTFLGLIGIFRLRIVSRIIVVQEMLDQIAASRPKYEELIIVKCLRRSVSARSQLAVIRRI